MAANKFLKQVNGVLTEELGTAVSTGITEANKIVALDATGRLDTSLMPVGVASETDTIIASENLSAGDFVNIWSSTGAKVRKADANTAGKEAMGFVLSPVTSGQSAIVYRSTQSNTALAGMTPGAKQYLSTTAGLITETIPSGSGNVIQYLGIAKSATELIFAVSEPITLA